MAETIRPRRIRLEASSDCQLRCSLCPQTTGAIAGAVGRGYLKAADFDALAAANPWLREVELSNLGEIFLNPELPEIMEAAHRRDVALSADTGANMNTVGDDALDALVRYRFRRITVSLDGASGETYALYRNGGSFDAVVENVHPSLEAAEELGIHPSTMFRKIKALGIDVPPEHSDKAD